MRRCPGPPHGWRDGQTGKRRMHRMGIGRIFPIWYVNEGRYRVRPSQQASMAKYQQQSRRTPRSSPHNLGGHGFVEQRVSCVAVMSWARSSSPPPVCLSSHLTDLSLVKIRKGKPRSLIRGPTRPKSKGERREDLPRRDPAAVSRAPLFFPSPLPPLPGDKPRPWPGGVCYLRVLNK